jgi:hypothetical protein
VRYNKMNCYYHPDREAKTKCSNCNQPLCDQCTIQHHGSPVCSRCIAILAAQDATEQIDERLADKEVKKSVRAAKKKKNPYLFILIPVSLLVGIALISLNLYFKATMPFPEKSTTPENPLITMILLDQAILDYIKEHGGETPRNLNEVAGGYISTEENTSRDLRLFDYKQIPPNSYELKPKDTGDETTADFVFTESGVNQ